MRVFAEQRRSDPTERGSEARLSFCRVGTSTVIDSAFATSPLRLLTPRNHGGGAWAYTSTLGGGLVDGDAIRLHVKVGPGAAAALFSQGENRVYRSPGGCRSDLIADPWLQVIPVVHGAAGHRISGWCRRGRAGVSP